MIVAKIKNPSPESSVRRNVEASLINKQAPVGPRARAAKIGAREVIAIFIKLIRKLYNTIINRLKSSLYNRIICVSEV